MFVPLKVYYGLLNGQKPQQHLKESWKTPISGFSFETLLEKSKAETKETMNSTIKFLTALFLALIMDALDFLGGFLPVVGDVADLIGIVFLYPLIGKYALLGGAEFIPFIDFLPCFTFSVIVWKMREGK